MLLQRVVHKIVEVDKLALALARALDSGSGWLHGGGSGIKKEVDVDVLAT